MAAPMIVAIRGLTTRQATLTLDERAVAALAEVIDMAGDGTDWRPDPSVVKLGEQLRGFAEVWDAHPHEGPQSD